VLGRRKNKVNRKNIRTFVKRDGNRSVWRILDGLGRRREGSRMGGREREEKSGRAGGNGRL